MTLGTRLELKPVGIVHCSTKIDTMLSRNLVLSTIPLPVQRVIFNAMLDGETIDVEAQCLKPKLCIHSVLKTEQNTELP